MQLGHEAENGPTAQFLIDPGSVFHVDDDRRAAFEEDSQLVRFRVIELGEVPAFADWFQNPEHLFLARFALAEQAFVHFQFAAFHRIIGVEAVPMVHGDAGKGIDDEHPGKDKGEVSMPSTAP